MVAAWGGVRGEQFLPLPPPFNFILGGLSAKRSVIYVDDDNTLSNYENLATTFFPGPKINVLGYSPLPRIYFRAAAASEHVASPNQTPWRRPWCRPCSNQCIVHHDDPAALSDQVHIHMQVPWSECEMEWEVAIPRGNYRVPILHNVKQCL